jgi:predicted enzyme related to lactoylglutathione lyase
MATGRLNLVEAKGDGPSRGTQIGFAVDDIDAGHARAVAAGAEVIHPPRAEPWDQRLATATPTATSSASRRPTKPC